MAGNNEVGKGQGGGNETNLSNLFASKKSAGADYLNSKNTKKSPNNSKKDGGNIKKNVKAVKGSDYLTADTKKAFNNLRHMFTQAFILQHFDLK